MCTDQSISQSIFMPGTSVPFGFVSSVLRCSLNFSGHRTSSNQERGRSLDLAILNWNSSTAISPQYLQCKFTFCEFVIQFYFSTCV